MIVHQGMIILGKIWAKVFLHCRSCMRTWGMNVLGDRTYPQHGGTAGENLNDPTLIVHFIFHCARGDYVVRTQQNTNTAEHEHSRTRTQQNPERRERRIPERRERRTQENLNASRTQNAAEPEHNPRLNAAEHRYPRTQRTQNAGSVRSGSQTGYWGSV